MDHPDILNGVMNTGRNTLLDSKTGSKFNRLMHVMHLAARETGAPVLVSKCNDNNLHRIDHRQLSFCLILASWLHCILWFHDGALCCDRFWYICACQMELIVGRAPLDIISSLFITSAVTLIQWFPVRLLA